MTSRLSAARAVARGNGAVRTRGHSTRYCTGSIPQSLLMPVIHEGKLETTTKTKIQWR